MIVSMAGEDGRPHVRSETQSIYFRQSFLRCYLAAALCFLVLNITNDKIPGIVASAHLGTGVSRWVMANFDKNVAFFVIPAKAAIFFVGTVFLLIPLVRTWLRSVSIAATGSAIRQTAVSMACCAVLTATIFPLGFGLQYARISPDPFNQPVGQFYRRLLLPGLANIFHLDGFLYVVLFWIVVFLSAVSFKLFLIDRGFQPNYLHEISLLTTGVFASSYQAPGYPEAVVILLATVALLEFQRNRVFAEVQLSAFALALVAHETCAVIVFMPLFLWFFGRKSWLPGVALLLLYLTFLAMNFSFDIATPFRQQDTVAGASAQDYFHAHPLRALAGGVFSFKLLWLLIPVGLFSQFKRGSHDRGAVFVVTGILFAAVSTYLGTDYSRLVSFATIPVGMCVVWAFQVMPRRLFDGVMLANLALPSFCVVGTTGLVTFRGLYDLVYSSILNLPLPPST